MAQSTNPLKQRPPADHTLVLSHLFLAVTSIFFALPLVIVVAASFTDEAALTANGFSVFPTKFSLEAYSLLLSNPAQIMGAYAVSMIVSIVGSLLALLIMALMAYPLSRREFNARGPLTVFVVFPMLFNGGLVASYILNTQAFRLTDSYAALILPALVVPFYVFLLRTYFLSIPAEIIEAARIDGASEWRIFFQLVLPLSTPALATVGLLLLLGFWNDYFLGLLYLRSPEKFPLQLLLFNVLNNIQYLAQLSGQSGVGTQLQNVQVPTQTIRMAMAVLATGPMAFAFILFQRHFVRGLTLGALKG
jgi:putative aldouronate transport system permease protein